VTSPVRSTEVSPDDVPLPIWIAIGLWVLLGGAVAVGIVVTSTGSGQVVLAAATGVALLGPAVGIGFWLHTGRIAWVSAGLIISAVAMPTTFAYVVNLLPIATAVVLLIRHRRTTR